MMNRFIAVFLSALLFIPYICGNISLLGKADFFCGGISSEHKDTAEVIYDGRLSWLNSVPSDEACVEATGLTKEEVANLWLSIWKDESLENAGTYTCTDGKIASRQNPLTKPNKPTINRMAEEFGSISDAGTASVTVGDRVGVLGYFTNRFSVGIEGKTIGGYCIDPLLHNPSNGDYAYHLRDTNTPGTWEYAMANILYCSEQKTSDFIDLWNQACSSAGADPTGEVNMSSEPDRYFMTHMFLGNTVHNGQFWHDLNGHEAFKVAFGYMYTNLCNYGHAGNYRLYLVAIDQSSNAYYQNLVFGTFAPTGFLRINKSCDQPELVSNNPHYSLSGAKYGVYTDSSCRTLTQMYNDANTPVGSAVLTTKENGSTDSIRLQAGNYYIKEISASPGYSLDTTIYPVTVTKDQTTGQPVVVNVKEKPMTKNPFTIFKADADHLDIYHLDKNGNPVAGNYGVSLEGAVFEIKFFTYDLNINQASVANPDAVWYLLTRFDPTTKTYRLDLSENDLAPGYTSSPFYKQGNSVVLPYGTIYITEVKAPDGYTACDPQLIPINSTPFTQVTVEDRITHGDIRFIKHATDDEPLAHVKFKITGENGEVYDIETDDNGCYKSSVSDPNVFRYGMNYTIEELECPENKDYQLMEPVKFKISKENEVIELGIIYDAPIPTLSTTERDYSTGTHKSIINLKTGMVEIDDTVHFENLTCDSSYVLKGVLMELSDAGKVVGPVLDPSGNPVTSSCKFMTQDTYSRSVNEASGEVVMHFSFQGDKYYGKHFVIFEYLFEGDDETPIPVNKDKVDTTGVYTVRGKMICHADATDINQIGYLQDVSVKSYTTRIIRTEPTTMELTTEATTEVTTEKPKETKAPKTGDTERENIRTALICMIMAVLAAIFILSANFSKKNPKR